VPFRPRAATSDSPAFLLANASGLFLLQVAPCRFDLVTQAQVGPVADDEEELEEDVWETEAWRLDDPFAWEEDGV